MNMQALMAQAQKMQRDLQKSKEELNKMSFTGKSEWATIEMSGSKAITDLKITVPGSIDQDDVEALADMIKIAYNDALKQVEVETEKTMGQFGGALNGLF